MSLMRRLCFDTSSTSQVQKLNTCEYQLLFNNEIPCEKLVLVNAIIPYTYYNVYDANNSFYLNDNDTKLTIPKGSYNITQFLEALMNTIVLNSTTHCKTPMLKANLDFTYDSITMKVKLRIVNYDALKINFDTCYELIGGSSDTDYVLSNNIVYQMPFVINMVSIPAIYIRTYSNINPHFIYNNHLSNIYRRIPVNVKPGEMIIFENNSIDMFVRTSHLNNLIFSLTDNKGNQIDLNGSHWKLEMLLISD